LKDQQSPKARRGIPRWPTLFVGSALLFVGCATPAPEVSPEDLRAVQQRVEDVERTNGRLMVRVEEMERQMALMQDRVESNRIALQRRGYLRQRDAYAEVQPQEAQRPQPAPQSNYQSDYRADPTMQQRMDQRGVARIPLSQEQSGHIADHDTFDSYDFGELDSQPGQEIVITNEKLEEYFGRSSGREQASTPRETTTSTPRRSGSAHPPVTSERLPTSQELSEGRAQADSVPSQPESAPPRSRSQRDLLDLYQDSLAQYRAGDYADALRGFTEFLQSGPRADYVDNALYWIGECHYGLGEFEASVRYFQRILDELPSATKVPDAMLKMSLAFDQMGQPHRSLELLVDLTERFPRTNPGRLGADRLESHPLYDGR
jgi:tol-pal system protein YbgF